MPIKPKTFSHDQIPPLLNPSRLFQRHVRVLEGCRPPLDGPPNDPRVNNENYAHRDICFLRLLLNHARHLKIVVKAASVQISAASNHAGSEVTCYSQDDICIYWRQFIPFVKDHCSNLFKPALTPKYTLFNLAIMWQPPMSSVLLVEGLNGPHSSECFLNRQLYMVDR